MPSKQLFVKHLFEGGWAPDFGPYSSVAPDDSGILRLPYLFKAENIIYEFDGAPHKMPGADKINSAEMESGAVVKGCYDFWRQGTGGTPSQHRIVHVGTKIKNDDADGTFSDLFTGMESGVIPAYSTFDDILIISSTSTADVPKSWDGSTAQSLAGSPPNFAFSATHKNRSWAAGDVANPSRLYYSVLLDPEDWTSSGSGTIDIDPNDGDTITGIISHKNELWVFKGPNKGSIHRITGSSPTGDDAFARTTFVNGVGAVWHNAIFRFADDVGFLWTDGSIRSLSATAAFGDYNEVALSRPIQNWIREHANFGRLKHAWATNVSSESMTLLTLAIDGSTNNNAILMMDYRFQPVRWAYWSSIEAASIAPMNDPNEQSRPIVMVGGNDGFLRRLLRSDRNIDGSTAITAVAAAPFLDYGTAIRMKTLVALSLGLAPKNDGDIVLGWQRDTSSQQTTNVGQGTSAATLGSLTLGTDVLGGATYANVFTDATEGGEFRAIQYEISNNILDEDMEVHNIGALISVGGMALED